MKTRATLRKDNNNVQTAELAPELMEATASNETTYFIIESWYVKIHLRAQLTETI